MKKKSPRPYVIIYNLLAVQDLWRAHYHVNMGIEHVELNTNIVNAVLNTQTLPKKV